MSQYFSIIISAFRLRSVLVCFVYFSEKKLIFRNSITRLFYSICIVFSVREKVNFYKLYGNICYFRGLTITIYW